MLFDAVKRFFGVGGNLSSNDHEQQPQPEPQSPISIYNNGQLVPFNRDHHMPPDISQIESEIAQVHKFMEQQMRTMMGSFGFSFGNPFSGFGFEDDSHGPFIGSPPFTGNMPNFPNISDGQEISPPLEPRDEVLKPQFRSKSAGQWSGQDKILDDRLNNEGLDSIIGELNPSNGIIQERSNPMADTFLPFIGNDLFRNGLFGGVLQPGQESSFVQSSSTMTVYSNVNGHKSMEKIVRHPDGRIERTVITDDGNPNQ